MKNKVKDIDFNNRDKVDEILHKNIEISVGALAYLLDYFYAGGGEPDDYNKRLQMALQNGVNR